MIIVGIGLFWLLLTIIFQFDNGLSTSMARFDRFGIIPKWTFFAPEPGEHDMHLLFRKGRAGELSQWNEAPLTSELKQGKRWRYSFFNPERRFEKMLFDFSNEAKLTKSMSQLRHLSDYIMILKYLESVSKDMDGNTIQFMLVGSTSLSSELHVFIVSDVHEAGNI